MVPIVSGFLVKYPLCKVITIVRKIFIGQHTCNSDYGIPLGPLIFFKESQNFTILKADSEEEKDEG